MGDGFDRHQAKASARNGGGNKRDISKAPNDGTQNRDPTEVSVRTKLVQIITGGAREA